jgi:carboxyl-terminal processing protease
MKKRAELMVVVLLWSVVLFGAGWLTRSWAMSALAPATGPAQSSSDYALLDEVWAHVREGYVGDVPTDTVRNYGAIRGELATLGDRWTVLVEPQSHTAEREQLSGQFGGIGVGMHLNEAGQVVLSPRPDSPASEAGVKEGDILIGVDGEMLPDKPGLDDVLARVRGEVGASVRITVLRADQQMAFTITRTVIPVPSVESRVITGTSPLSGTIGYIAIHTFTERTGSEVKDAVGELRKKGSQAYLIDLRDNGGGLLNSAVDVASIFLDKGAVLIQRRRNQPDITFPVNKDEKTGVYREPIAVLVNGNTASAAEIVSGAIQDNQRGPLIGEKTYGKGSVQSIYDLSDGSSVHITSAKWLTPNQRAIDGVGLSPDVSVKRADGEVEYGKDSQIDRALIELRSSLAQH